jgi:FkbM family methyltransferase
MAAVPSLCDILHIPITVDVVDVGANPVDGDPPYKRLLTQGRARVVGFEPIPEALAKLNAAKGPNETYLGAAVGDGKRHIFHLCQLGAMSSILEPNAAFLDYLHLFPEWGKVLSKSEIDTVRLDDISEITACDFLKIDIQGAELMVFQNAAKRLADCLVIQTEVEFFPFYIDQPLYAEVDLFLRQQGFMIHNFVGMEKRFIQPLMNPNDPKAGLNQIMWADAVFVRDFTKIDRLDDGQLLRMALLMHDIYRSFDVVVRLLMEHDRRRGTKYCDAYMSPGKAAGR